MSIGRPFRINIRINIDTERLININNSKIGMSYELENFCEAISTFHLSSVQFLAIDMNRNSTKISYKNRINIDTARLIDINGDKF